LQFYCARLVDKIFTILQLGYRNFSWPTCFFNFTRRLWIKQCSPLANPTNVTKLQFRPIRIKQKVLTSAGEEWCRLLRLYRSLIADDDFALLGVCT